MRQMLQLGALVPTRASQSDSIAIDAMQNAPQNSSMGPNLTELAVLIEPASSDRLC
jgi:hypothetical protein